MSIVTIAITLVFSVAKINFYACEGKNKWFINYTLSCFRDGNYERRLHFLKN
jgi:hypothetical protein